MKERPIIFSGPMVRAILDGRKTQTRRVVLADKKIRRLEQLEIERGRDRESMPFWLHLVRCPWGDIGDRLWVRESFARGGYNLTDDSPAIAYRATHVHDGLKWKPAIFMPRWACRLKLEITHVRLQQLQSMSPEDAKAEGTEQPTILEGKPISWPLCDFSDFWDSLNATRGYGWSMNPWVWAITFKRIEGGT